MKIAHIVIAAAIAATPLAASAEGIPNFKALTKAEQDRFIDIAVSEQMRLDREADQKITTLFMPEVGMEINLEKKGVTVFILQRTASHYFNSSGAVEMTAFVEYRNRAKSSSFKYWYAVSGCGSESGRIAILDEETGTPEKEQRKWSIDGPLALDAIALRICVAGTRNRLARKASEAKAVEPTVAASRR